MKHDDEQPIGGDDVRRAIDIANWLLANDETEQNARELAAFVILTAPILENKLAH